MTGDYFCLVVYYLILPRHILKVATLDENYTSDVCFPLLPRLEHTSTHTTVFDKHGITLVLVPTPSESSPKVGPPTTVLLPEWTFHAHTRNEVQIPISEDIAPSQLASSGPFIGKVEQIPVNALAVPTSFISYTQRKESLCDTIE